MNKLKKEKAPAHLIKKASLRVKKSKAALSKNTYSLILEKRVLESYYFQEYKLQVLTASLNAKFQKECVVNISESLAR